MRHVVMFRFEDHVGDDDVVEMAAALDRLPGAIDSIVDYRHGRDLGLGPATFDYAIVAQFADVDGFTTYRDHPEHQRFIADHITGKVAERASVQFDD